MSSNLPAPLESKNIAALHDFPLSSFFKREAVAVSVTGLVGSVLGSLSFMAMNDFQFPSSGGGYLGLIGLSGLGFIASLTLVSFYYEMRMKMARDYLRETYLEDLIAYLETSEDPALQRLLWCVKNNHRYPSEEKFSEYQKWFRHLHERVFNGKPLPQYFLSNMGALSIKEASKKQKSPTWLVDCVNRYQKIVESRFWSEEDMLPIPMSINALIGALETHADNHPDIVSARAKLEAFLDGFNIEAQRPKAMQLFDLAMADK